MTNSAINRFQRQVAVRGCPQTIKHQPCEECGKAVLLIYTGKKEKLVIQLHISPQTGKKCIASLKEKGRA